ncbi:hypothetical protein Y032_0181g844 [Ancylostoma ceylanicum]|uniref:Uncharacterized protein n=1 Tax=Ancylostoma ceylanicum TaxID=53326 RepID=A0A016SSX5_9BILA|nr:hypothetical protein Y032_0181g844 [Ancylostoma ceylanicum]
MPHERLFLTYSAQSWNLLDTRQRATGGKTQLSAARLRIRYLRGDASVLEELCGFLREYGYDLPLNEPAAYYDIWYNGINSSFLYPDFCVMSSEPMPIQFRDEYILTSRASDEFLSDFASGKHMICGVEAQLATVDPKFISLPVRPLGSESRRRRISTKPTVSHPRENRSFLVDLVSSTDSVNSTGKFEEDSKPYLPSFGPTVDPSRLQEATPFLSSGTPSFARIPRTTKTPQKLMPSKPKVNTEVVRNRKRRIDVE